MKMFYTKNEHEAALEEKQSIIDGLNKEKATLSDSAKEANDNAEAAANLLQSEKDAHALTSKSLNTANARIVELEAENAILAKNPGAVAAEVKSDKDITASDKPDLIASSDNFMENVNAMKKAYIN